MKFSQWLESTEHAFWHGSPTGDFGPGPIHIGSHLAAKQALEARIGIPAQGEWDGTKEYGKTLLAGRKRIQTMENGEWRMTGQNSDCPEEDYYPTGATFSDGTAVPMTAKPNIFPVKIVGPMTNSRWNPHSDIRANALMRGLFKKGGAKRGFYYTNDSEDSGSISAVVPNPSHLQRI